MTIFHVGAGMDPQRVIYLGTFSKVFAPGVRSGWIDPPANLVEKLRAVCEIMTLSPSALNQAIIGEYHRRHGWDELLDITSMPFGPFAYRVRKSKRPAPPF